MVANQAETPEWEGVTPALEAMVVTNQVETLAPEAMVVANQVEALRIRREAQAVVR